MSTIRARLVVTMLLAIAMYDGAIGAPIDADVLLFDQAMIDYVRGPRAAWALEQGPGTRNPGAEELERFVATHTVRQVDVVDPSYGRFEIYYLRR